MCVEIRNLDTKKVACTIEELASMIEVDLDFLNNHLLHGYSEVNPDYCLCGLDIFGACDEAGFVAEFNKVYDIEIKKKIK